MKVQTATERGGVVLPFLHSLSVIENIEDV